MKKALLLLASVAAVAACSKTEVTPVTAEDTEITYNVAPKVKATTAFNTDWTFKSTALYLPSGETWDSHTTTPTTYIDAAEIEYNTTKQVWKNAAKTYYWPKTGKLTFFAWTAPLHNPSDSTYTNATVPGTVTVDATNGVKIASHDVVTNKNYDILVADITEDQKQNLTTYYTAGVATLFRHKLSKVRFTAKTAQNYGSDITFKINSIKFKGIDSKGVYVQLPTEGWTTSTPADQTYYSSTTGQTVTSTAAPITGDQVFYMPQEFDNDGTTTDAFVVNYTISITNGTNTTSETIDYTVSLNSATAGKAVFAEWKMGYIYTIKLTLGLNEILWDPAIEKWDTASQDITIQ